MNINVESHGVLEIVFERERQALKWPEDHDDEHVDQELLIAAAQLIDAVLRPDGPLPDMWGLVSKHQHPRKRLAIAGALIAAELDRRERRAIREASR